MTRFVNIKIAAIEQPFSITVAIVAMFMLGALYTIFISSAVESAARADNMRESIADLYSEIGGLESSYVKTAGAIDADTAGVLGYVSPVTTSFVNMSSQGLSFVSSLDR